MKYTKTEKPEIISTLKVTDKYRYCFISGFIKSIHSLFVLGV